MSARAKSSRSKSAAAAHPTANPEATTTAPLPAEPVTRRSLTAVEQQHLLQLPVHETEAMRSYVKPHEGFERVAPLSLKRLAEYPDIVSALRLDVAELEAALGQAAVLAEQEGIAFRLHRRALENRLCVESTVYRALLKLNRFLQASADEELQRDFSELADWVAARMEGARRRDPGEPDTEPEPATPGHPPAG